MGSGRARVALSVFENAADLALTTAPASRQRLRPDKSFPSYAYLPAREAHEAWEGSSWQGVKALSTDWYSRG